MIDCYLFRVYQKPLTWPIRVWGLTGGSAVKNLPAKGGEDPLEKEVATHSSILAWKTPLTEELCGLVHAAEKESDRT